MQILVADDSPLFRDLLRRFLSEWHYEVILAQNGEEAWEHLRQSNGPRMAVLDWNMPGMTGAEVCRKVRSEVTDRYVYMVLLSAHDEMSDIVAGLDSGADDYIVKPFQGDELEARLRAGRRLLALQDELVAAREALREQAMHDSLTGLWSRKAIFEILGNELARSSRHHESLIVLMADLDNFKQVNDNLGHIAGDMVLLQAATLMKASVRRYDAAGRYGGDEFMIVLPGCEIRDGALQAERVRAAIEAEVFSAGEHRIRLTCSLGACCTRLTEYADPQELVRLADQALYRAKRLGRNRVELQQTGDPAS